MNRYTVEVPRLIRHNISVSIRTDALVLRIVFQNHSPNVIMLNTA